MSTSLQPLGHLSPGQDLNGYIQSVNRIAVLTAEEEHELALRLHEENHLESARRLVMSHLRFVVHSRAQLQRLWLAAGGPDPGKAMSA